MLVRCARLLSRFRPMRLHTTLTVLPALLILLHEADCLDASHDRLTQIAAEPVPTALLPATNLGMSLLKATTFLRRTRRVNLHACVRDRHH
jgi:hypothetical protein